jgi:predicted DNA-binding transcriptional regulator YafY
MNRLIKHRATGSPGEFARLLGISRTRLYEMIDELKSQDVPIAYDKSANTFYYEQPFDVSVSFSVRPLQTREEKLIQGGHFSFAYLFSGRCDANFIYSKLTGC